MKLYPMLLLLGSLFVLSEPLAGQATTDSAARTAAPTTPTPIRTLLYHGPVVTAAPVCTDSTDISGKPFDVTMLAEQAVPNPRFTPFVTVTAGAAGHFPVHMQAANPAQSYQTHYYSVYIRSGSYSRGYLSVDTPLAWEVFLDGNRMDAAPQNTAADRQPASVPLTLMPQLQTLTVRLTTNDSTLSAEQLRLALGFTPERAGADVAFLTTPTRYADLMYMIYEPMLTATATSPSGRYSLLSMREYPDYEQSVTRTYLYDGPKRVMELTGALAKARWMPSSDRLCYDAPSREGRSLYAWSPADGQTETLARQLPEQVSYTILPSEQALLLHTEQKGKAYKTTLDRFASPRERISGFRDRSFLSLYTFATGQTQPLTFGNRSTHLQSISNDGQRLIFATQTPTPTELPFSRNDYYELDLETMRIDTLLADARGIAQVMYTARDGQLLVTGSAESFDYIGCVLPEGAPVNSYDTQLFLYDQRTKQAKALSRELDRSIVSVEASRTRFEAVFLAELGHDKALYGIDLATGKLRRLSHAETVIRSFSLAPRGERITYYGQSDSNADRYYSLNLRQGREQLVYDLSATKLRHVQLGRVQDWDWTAPDGTHVDGFYCLPPEFDSTRRYPLLVYYYGGTAPVSRTLEGAYSPQMLASMGYVVYVLNPSGTTGYGQAYSSRHVNAWGKRTAEEIIGAVRSFAAAHTFVDDKRIGCMGASYGGFMTMYLQTQTDLFAAACSHAGISSISSYWGEGYWGVGYSTVASRGSYPWNNPKLYTEQSPLFLADRIKTPLLLIHGLSDTNVPVGESWQMFNALRILGRPVEFVGVYEEDHHILNPRKRYEWTSAIMAFFARYLQDDPTWWNDLFPDKY